MASDGYRWRLTASDRLPVAQALSSEAQQAADEALARDDGAAGALEVARDARANAMRMAMELQSTFDALVPYFVYRTVLEQVAALDCPRLPSIALDCPRLLSITPSLD